MTKLTQEWARIRVTRNDLVVRGRTSATNNAVAKAVRRSLGLKTVAADESTVTVVVKGQSYVASLPAKVRSLFVGKAAPLSFSIRFNRAS